MLALLAMSPTEHRVIDDLELLITAMARHQAQHHSVWKGGRRLRPTPLNDRAIAEVVKRAAQAAGYDPARFSGHSLRAGLVTTAAAAGVDERTIMEQTGHKTTTMVRRYMRRGSLFRNNAAAKVGL